MPEAPKLCSHQSQYPEGVEWPADVSLDHFQHCLDAAQQLEWWKRFRDAASQGHRCFETDHAGRIANLTHTINDRMQAVRVQDTYIGQQMAKLREMESEAQKTVDAELPMDPVWALERVQAILGIVTSNGEEL